MHALCMKHTRYSAVCAIEAVAAVEAVAVVLLEVAFV